MGYNEETKDLHVIWSSSKKGFCSRDVKLDEHSQLTASHPHSLTSITPMPLDILQDNATITYHFDDDDDDILVIQV